MTASSLRSIVTLLFFFSGLSSLVLETVWIRMMVLVFGSTTFAVSTVLTAFMGGLALGSWFAGRRAGRIDRPGRALAWYGLLELGIGIYALLLPLLAARIHMIHDVIWGATHHSSYYTFALLRFLLAGLLLLAPTVAMGATLPVLAQYTCAGQPSVITGRRVGFLYAINTAGAVAGVFLAGFVLLPSVGMRATNSLACMADLALGIAALLLCRIGHPDGAPDPAPACSREPDGPIGAFPTWYRRFALISIGYSGAVAMVYQVAWTRVLSLIIGSSTYAFSLILICFLVGLSAGAALYARRQTRSPDQAANLSIVHLLVAVTAFAGILFTDRLPVLFLLILRGVELASTTLFVLKFVLSGTIILLPTLFMGMVFPAVIRIYAIPSIDVARATGTVYAANTLGAIVGSFAGGFLLVPWVGLQRTLLVMVLAGLLLAALFGLLALRSRAKGLRVLAAIAVAAAVCGGARPWNLERMNAGVFRPSRYEGLLPTASETGTPRRFTERVGLDRWLDAARRAVPPEMAVETGRDSSVGHKIVFHREGVTTTVSVSRSVDLSLAAQSCWVRHSLLVNGKPDASLNVLVDRPADGCEVLLRRAVVGEQARISPASDAETQILSGLLPVCLYRAASKSFPDRALIIGWGSGVTVGAALQAPLRRLVAVELEQQVIEASRWFEPHNNSPRRDPRLRLVSEDGRNYLARSVRRYDVIISEPSNPWIAGCGNLFTKEFFSLVRSRLDDRSGIFLQWLQAYEIAPDNAWSILGTLARVFPSVQVFRPAQASSDMLIVARTDRDRRPSWPELERCLSLPGIRREMARIRIYDPADVVARILAGPDGVRRVTAGAPVNTDDNARIEFNTPKDLINYQRYSPAEISATLQATLGNPLEVLTDAPSDAPARTCRALLRAGRPERASLMGGAGDKDDDLQHCLRLARVMRRKLPRFAKGQIRALMGNDARVGNVLDLVSRPPDEIIAGLLRLFRPEVPKDRRLAFALLGHACALAARPYEALLLLLAAHGVDASGAPSYQPLSALLALLDADRTRALSWAERALDP